MGAGAGSVRAPVKGRDALDSETLVLTAICPAPRY